MKIRSTFKLSLMLLCVAALVAGCGKRSHDKSATVATVNGDRITQAQLDFAIKQIAAARPGASAPEPSQVLQGLVDQHLAVQKAEKDKLDRNPGVLQALEEARKDALARYYVEQFTANVPKPTADEIKQFYDSHPANFARRNIYTLQKVDVRVAPEQSAALAATVQATSGAPAVLDLLKSRGPVADVSQTARPAESLGPLLPKISTMTVGQSMAIPVQQGLTVLTLVAVQPQPVALEQAQASIEQAIWNQRKQLALQADAKELREKARITYLGKFAPGAASAPVAAASN